MLKDNKSEAGEVEFLKNESPSNKDLDQPEYWQKLKDTFSKRDYSVIESTEYREYPDNLLRSGVDEKRLERQLRKIAREKDPNFAAYQRMLRTGNLEEYRGRFVAFCNGQFVAYAETEENLRSRIDGDLPGQYLIQKVPKKGEPELRPIVYLRRPKRVVMPD